MATGVHNLGDYTIEDGSNDDYVIKDPQGNIIFQWDESNTQWTLNSNPLSGVSSLDGLSGNAVTSLEGTNLSVDGNGDLNVSGITDGAYDSVTTVTANHTASDNEVVLGDASGGAITVTLPSATSAVVAVIKKIDSSTNAVTIATPNTETIDGQSSIDITNQYASRTITSDGTNYFIL